VYPAILHDWSVFGYLGSDELYAGRVQSAYTFLVALNPDGMPLHDELHGPSEDHR
jgi:hypothetical protein